MILKALGLRTEKFFKKKNDLVKMRIEQITVITNKGD